MDNLLEFFKDFNINNIYAVVGFIVFLIIKFADCIQPIFATGIETLLMSKTDKLKRLSFVCIAFFIILGAINSICFISSSFSIIYYIISALIFILYLSIIIAHKPKKLDFFYSKHKNLIDIYLIIIFSPIITYAYSDIINITSATCIIICAFVEVIIVTWLCYDAAPKDSKFIVKLNNKKWYVFRRIDNNYLLCGDQKNIILSKEIKLVDINTIVQENINFERINVKNK